MFTRLCTHCSRSAIVSAPAVTDNPGIATHNRTTRQQTVIGGPGIVAAEAGRIFFQKGLVAFGEVLGVLRQDESSALVSVRMPARAAPAN